jgi:hypothetical protein
MSVRSALQDMLATREITHPVTFVGGSTRGVLDAAGQLVPLAGAQVEFTGTVLYLEKDAVPGIAQGAAVTVGELGAESAAGGQAYLLGKCHPIEDGLIVGCELGKGR